MDAAALAVPLVLLPPELLRAVVERRRQGQPPLRCRPLSRPHKDKPAVDAAVRAVVVRALEPAEVVDAAAGVVRLPRLPLRSDLKGEATFLSHGTR